MKLKKLPKKPKSTASIEVMQRYLHKVSEIKKENAKIIADEKKRKQMYEQIKKA